MLLREVLCIAIFFDAIEVLRFLIVHATETEIEICIPRRGFSARRNLHALTPGDQRSPTQHPRSFNVSEIAYHVLDTGCACNWIPVRGISVVIALVFIKTPFPNVARHIVETVIVSRIDTNSSRVSDISVVVCLVCIN